MNRIRDEESRSVTALSLLPGSRKPASIRPHGSAIGHARALNLGRPLLAAVTGYVHGQFQPAPDSEFVERTAQMVLDYLFTGADNLADFAIGQAFPDQYRDLNFLRCKALTRCHHWAFSFVNTAIANFTRLRPSRIPARKNSVRKCCFTVRGLMLSWPAISLLLQPCTSKFKPCRSRGVTLT